MNFPLLLRTVRYLKVKQLLYQVKNRVIKPKFVFIPFRNIGKPLLIKAPIEKWSCLKERDRFSFLNLSSRFSGWNDTRYGMLWAYNLNYMDWLLQEGMTAEEGAWWMDRFVADLAQNRVGLDPYPIALRGINWIKFIALHFDEIDQEKLQGWNDSLYSQYRLLEKKLEFHLLGNHLLEDAFSLYIAAVYFGDVRMYRKASELLLRELKEQLLTDGAHYEQSPMYHCILLDRLLDCYNVSAHNPKFECQEKDVLTFREYAIRMLGHLESMLYQDGTFPLFNDSAYGIAPMPVRLFEYAKRLGLNWCPISLNASGYRRMMRGTMEVFLDVGDIKASYQPGHAHADSFNYELRIKGVPFIVDTGISTYNKTERRQLERGTSAHNTVTVEGQNSSEVWGGFRMGKRAHVEIVEESDGRVRAFHDGFGSLGLHTRLFELTDNQLYIKDELSVYREARSCIHLAPGVRVLACSQGQVVTNIASVSIEGAEHIEIKKGKIASEYNVFQESLIIFITFRKEVSYRICV